MTWSGVAWRVGGGSRSDRLGLVVMMRMDDADYAADNHGVGKDVGRVQGFVGRGERLGLICLARRTGVGVLESRRRGRAELAAWRNYELFGGVVPCVAVACVWAVVALVTFDIYICIVILYRHAQHAWERRIFWPVEERAEERDDPDGRDMCRGIMDGMDTFAFAFASGREN